MKPPRSTKRTYVQGKTFGVRTLLRATGAHWDDVRKAWWFSDHETARRTVLSIMQGRSERLELVDIDAGEEPRIIARARFQNRTYYVIGESDGEASKELTLLDLDGMVTLQAPLSGRHLPEPTLGAVITHRYARPHTLREIHAFAAQARTFGTKRCVCTCHQQLIIRAGERCKRCRCYPDAKLFSRQAS